MLHAPNVFNSLYSYSDQASTSNIQLNYFFIPTNFHSFFCNAQQLYLIAVAVAKYPTFTTTTHPTLSCYDYPLKCGSGMTFLCKIYYYHYIPCPFPFLLQNKRERWKERMDYSLLYFHRRHHHHHHLHIIRRPLLLFISNNTNLVTFMDSTLELLFFYSRKKKNFHYITYLCFMRLPLHLNRHTKVD